jgi:hypothetical protein
MRIPRVVGFLSIAVVLSPAAGVAGTDDATVTTRATKPGIVMLQVLGWSRETERVFNIVRSTTTYSVVPQCTAPCSFVTSSGPIMLMASGVGYETQQETFSLNAGENKFLVTPGHALVRHAGVGLSVFGLAFTAFGIFALESRSLRTEGTALLAVGIPFLGAGVPMAFLGGTTIGPDPGP